MTSRQHGRIEVITGCMFSGKTEELIRRIDRAEIAGDTIKLFKPATDDRYNKSKVTSHNGTMWNAEIIKPGNELAALKGGVEAETVAFDEANFFTNKLVDLVEALAENGKRVIIAGTDVTFRGDGFEPMPELMARADQLDKLHAVCQVCGNRATENQRLVDGEPAHSSDPTVMVGGDESYQARCRHCHEVKSD